jgi:hypothetical protein
LHIAGDIDERAGVIAMMPATASRTDPSAADRRWTVVGRSDLRVVRKVSTLAPLDAHARTVWIDVDLKIGAADWIALDECYVFHTSRQQTQAEQPTACIEIHDRALIGHQRSLPAGAVT